MRVNSSYKYHNRKFYHGKDKKFSTTCLPSICWLVVTRGLVNLEIIWRVYTTSKFEGTDKLSYYY